MSEINIKHSTINQSQIGNINSNMIVVSGNDGGWKEIENIWKDALYETQKDLRLNNLVKEADKLTKKKDKEGLKKLLKNFFVEFTKDILSEAATEVVLKFLM